MAIQKSPWAKFNQTAARPQTSGAVHKQEFVYDASSGVLAADIIELGILPGNAKSVDAILFTEGAFGAVAANVGIMSGEIGSDDAGRTLGTELFAAQSLAATSTTIVRLTKAAALLVAPDVRDRSIGVQLAADVAAAAGLKLHLVLFYAQ
jgi:hypothetical protein